MSKVRFGDVVKEVKVNIDRTHNPYKFYVAGDHMDSEDLKIRRRGCFATDDVGPAFTRLFKPGQILYGSRRTYLKKIAVADFEGITANTTFVLETKDEAVFLQKLLPFVMLSDSFTEWSVKKSKGSTNPYVLFSDLADFEFMLPSVKEQQKLSELLWGAYDLKESYKRLLTATDELAKSRFVEIFGDPDANEYGWPLMSIKECVQSIQNGKSPVCENYPRTGLMPGVLKLSSISVGTFRPSENKTLRTNTPFLYEYEVKAGDLLLSRKNTYELVGMACFVFQTPAMLQLPDLIFRLQTKKNVHAIFLCQLLNHPSFRSHVQALAGGSAGSMPNISKQRLENLMIPLPPITLQNEFAAFIEQLDKSKLALQKSITNTDQLLRNLLKESIVE